jgi:hypothetical protein
MRTDSGQCSVGYKTGPAVPEPDGQVDASMPNEIDAS